MMHHHIALAGLLVFARTLDSGDLASTNTARLAAPAAHLDVDQTAASRDFNDGTDGSGAAGKPWTCKGKARSVNKIEPPPDCPRFVTGTGKDRGEAQKAAKTTAPEHCRRFYGHFECWQDRR